ncbi:MAG: cytochrome c oxidase assembly protein [Gammaproteobacteria bacterium]|nr:cytochrome c oxidase assembly protein [Gammaproteobacteria bacterium]
MAEQELNQANSRLVRRLLIATVAMFGFGFALVPLYNLMCDTLGLNGRFLDIEQGKYEVSSGPMAQVDNTRVITVEFLANVGRDTSSEFRPMVHKIQLHPGEIKEVSYFAKNLSTEGMIAQAVPSLAPGKAVKYFTKMECFCFNKQPFDAGEEKVMPLRFFVDPDLPKDVSTISIAYTFFDITKNEQVNTGRSELASAQPVLPRTSVSH